MAASLLSRQPGLLEAHRVWVEASLASGGRWRLEGEYQALSKSEQPCVAEAGAFGLWRLATPENSEKRMQGLRDAAPACGEDGVLLLSSCLLDDGHAKEALAVLESRKEAAALAESVRARVALRRNVSAEAVVRRYYHGGGRDPEVGMGVFEESGGEDPGRAGSLALDAAEKALWNGEPDRVIAAWRLFGQAHRRAAAARAAALLAATVPGLELPPRQPFGDTMIQSMAVALVHTGGDASIIDALPPERAKIARAVVELERRGGDPVSESAALRIAVLLDPAAWDLRLDLAAVLLGPTGPEVYADALGAVFEAAHQVDEARVWLRISYALSVDRRRETVAEARALSLRTAALASAAAAGASLAEAADPGPLSPDSAVGLMARGRDLETAGHMEAALATFADAAALGAPEALFEIARLYRGPAPVHSLVEAARRRAQEPVVEPLPATPVHEDLDRILSDWRLDTATGPMTVSGLRGHVVVVAFWASWCQPCMTELPSLGQLKAHWTRDGLTGDVIAVSVDEDDRDFRRAMGLLSELGVHFARAPDLARALHVDAIPTTFVLDPAGRLRRVYRGFEKGFPEKLDAEVRAVSALRDR
jgi:thiol-disulfide isomerase/thioredoxin